jgi:cysteinyl-tRNA synthetase
MAGIHYRNEWEHNDRDLEAAEELARKLVRASQASPNGRKDALNPAPRLTFFLEAMDNDLGSPAAVRTLRELAEEILDGERTGRKIGEAQEVLRKLGNIFGLRLDGEGPDSEVAAGWEKHRRRFYHESGPIEMDGF